MGSVGGNARPFVISSARVSRKRGLTNAWAHGDIHQHHSGDSFCCALLCLRHLDEFRGACKHSRCLGGANHSAFAFGQLCHYFPSCIPLLEYPDSSVLHDLCGLAWDAKLFLPGSVLILAYICCGSSSWPPASQSSDRAFVFRPRRVCQRVRHHQCPLDSREANFRETAEPPGILAGPSGSPGRRPAPWTYPRPRFHPAHPPHALPPSPHYVLHYQRSLPRTTPTPQNLASPL